MKRIVIFNVNILNRIPSLKKGFISMDSTLRGKIQPRNAKGQFEKVIPIKIA